MFKHQINYLTPKELSILGEHVKLGMAHLQQHLTEKELDELLDASSLNEEQLGEVEYTETEVTGNLLIIMNTIFTTILGSFFAYSGFAELNLSSFWLFCVIIFIAGTLGAFIGYQSTQMVKQQAAQAVHAEKLHMLEIQILKKIRQKKEEEIQEMMNHLNDVFSSLSKGTSFEKKIFFSDVIGKSPHFFFQEMSKLDKMIGEKLALYKNDLVQEACAGELAKIQLEFKEKLFNSVQEKVEIKNTYTELQPQKEKKIDESLKKLVNTYPKKTTKPPSWIRSNARGLIIGIIPTFLGTFASFSVYLGGIPQVLKNFGYDELFAFFTNPEVKSIGFNISFLITLYFCFSYFYLNRKAFKRNQELEKTGKDVIELESALPIMDSQILTLKEITKVSSQFTRLFSLLDSLCLKLKV